MLVRGDTFSFDRLIHEHPVALAFFYADSCSKCRTIHPWVKEIGQSSDKVCIIELETGRDAELAYNFAVSTVPSFLLYKDGTFVDRKAGSQSRKKIEEFIESAL